MEYAPIPKPPVDQIPIRPNLDDYESIRATWSWDSIRGELDGMPGGGLNKAYECLDRHAKGARKDKTAMLWEGKNGERRTACAASASRRATASSCSSSGSPSATSPPSAP
jgi:hypothetical protein